jgi:hypothetical protein
MERGTTSQTMELGAGTCRTVKRLLAMARSALARLMHNVPNSGSIISQAPTPLCSQHTRTARSSWRRLAGVVSAAAARGPKNVAALSQNKCCDEAANTAREGGREGWQRGIIGNSSAFQSVIGTSTVDKHKNARVNVRANPPRPNNSLLSTSRSWPVAPWNAGAPR